nr:zinc finger CCCH domain-containing protein 11-like [Tanacetum cinerariifolium]
MIVCKADGKENESKSSGMTSNNFWSKVLDELREEKVESIGMKSKELVELDDKNMGMASLYCSKDVDTGEAISIDIKIDRKSWSVVPKPDHYELVAKKTKDEEKAREKELNDLFKIVVVQHEVPPSVDPKSILGEFFKAGQCAKGFKLEKRQYGWYWVCPNGNKECHCRHDLLPGYILKSQMKALLEEEANKLAIEDEIEDQCAKLKPQLR